MNLEPHKRGYRQPAVIFAVLALALAGALIAVLRWQTMSLIGYEHDHLAEIASLKVQAIEEWLAHNRQDAIHIAGMLSQPQGTGRQAENLKVLERRLAALRKSFAVDALLLLDSQGHRIAAAGEKQDLNVADDMVPQVAAVAGKNRPDFDFIHPADGARRSPVFLDYLVPVQGIRGGNGGRDVLVLRRRAATFLYPLVQLWPSNSVSAETLLVRRSGNDVELINNSRFAKDSAFSLRLPLDKPELPAVKGLLADKAALVDGRDYRGVQVLAAARPIKGTEWVMISKIDSAEALAPIHHLAWVWSGGILGVLTLAALGASTLWRQTIRVADSRQTALESERRAIAERFKILSRFATDIILLIDERDCIVEANERAFESYGIPRDKLIGSPVSILWSPTGRDNAGPCFDDITKDATVLYEAVHVTADGREFPVEISGHRVDAEGERYVLKIIRDISERKRAEAALRENKDHLQTIIERLPFGMIVTKEDGAPAEFINQAFKDITGYGEEETDTFDKAMRHMVPDPEWRAAAAVDRVELMAEARSTGRPSQKRMSHLIRRDGALRHVEFQFVDLETVGVWIFNDVTARIEAEQRVMRLSMLKDALSTLNREIVRLNSEQNVWEQASRVAVERAGSVAAWVGVADTGTQSVHCVASNGKFADGLSETLCGAPLGAPGTDELVAAAMKDGKTVVCRDFINDPRTSRWHELGKQHNVASSAVVPLLQDGKVVAVLAIYLDETGQLDGEMVDLFEEMASDLCFALQAIKAGREREQALAELEESDTRFRTIIEQTISGNYIVGPDKRFIYVNPRLAEIFGYESGEEIIGKSTAELIAPEDRALVAENLKKRLTGAMKTIRYDFTGLRKDGSTVTIGAHGTAGVYRGQPVVIGALQDVTEMRRAEEQARQYVETLERTTHNTVEIISTMIELRDPYTQGHERRVGEIAAAISAEMGFDEKFMEGMRVAGHLHDVGKISVPAEILSKPGRLSDIEYQLVKGHAQQGYDILKGYEFPWPIAQIVLQHHERLDGSGYPQGLKGDEISIEARILGVSDTVEAMSEHRPYRPGRGLETALAEIEQNSGRLYDPQVVGACLRLFREKGYKLPA